MAVWKIGRIVLLLAGLLVAGCGSSDNTDASAELACSHFRNVANDVSAGILNTTEFRDKIKEIYDTASVSDDAEVREEAQGMLAAATDVAAGESGSAERFK